MTVIPDGLPAELEVEEKSSNNQKNCENKEKNGEDSNETMKSSTVILKSEILKVILATDDGDSCSDNDPNEDEEKKVTNCKTKKTEKKSSVDELTTQVLKMKVNGEKKEDSVQNVTNKLSELSVKEASEDGRKSPQLLARGPDGGKPTNYNHMMYGQQDWSAVKAESRIKAQSGKRGYEEEDNPFKYIRNIEPVENGDYSYIDPQGYQQQSMQGMHTQSSMNQVYAPQQAMQRPRAQAYRQNVNQASSFQGYMMTNRPRNVLSGGSVTVASQNTVDQTTFNPSEASDWDPDAILELLDPKEELQFQQNPPQAYGQQNPQQFQTDEQIMNLQMNGLQKTKRNLSGDESGYDSEVSRMSITSPYSPDSVISQESLPSPQSVNQSNTPQYVTQYSPYSNIGSPRSVDSGMISDGSPASYRDMASPASQMAVTSPANTMYVDTPTPSPPLTMPPPSPADTIMSDLYKPIPKSPVTGTLPTGQYIDKNLDNLRDVYQVISNDLQKMHHGPEKTGAIKTEKETKISNVSMPTSLPNHKQTVKQEIIPDKAAVPIAGVPVSQAMTPVVSMTNTMTPVILQPVTTAGVSCPVPAAQPQLVRFGQPGKVPVVGQPIVNGGQNIVWVPFNPGVLNASNSAPIIVVRQPTPVVAPKKGGPTKPRPILPKLPNIMPGNKVNTPSTPSSNKASPVSSPPIKTQGTPVPNPVMANCVSRQVSNPSPQRPAAVPIMAPTTTPPLINGHLQQIQQQQQMVNCVQRPAPIVQPAPGQAQVNQQNVHRTDGVNKLNLARRYVAAMKTGDLYYQDQEGDTYLHVAICRTDPYLVKAILERLEREGLIKELIDKPNKKRQTPIYMAVADNQPFMVRELVQCGADPNSLAECKYYNGLRKEVKAAIHCAAQGGHLFLPSLQELLKAQDIALNLANSEGLTALHCAIEEHRKCRNGQEINSIPTVELLIKAGADPNVQDKKSGKTPLMYAIETKDYNLVACMVNLIEKDKLRNMLRTQTFDGSNCSKICSGLRMDSDMCGWRKINSLILSASTGSDNRLYDGSSMSTV